MKAVQASYWRAYLTRHRLRLRSAAGTFPFRVISSESSRLHTSLISFLVSKTLVSDAKLEKIPISVQKISKYSGPRLAEGYIFIDNLDREVEPFEGDTETYRRTLLYF